MEKKTKSKEIFDLRTLDYKLQKGIISRKEYNSHLESLPDEEGNLELVPFEEESIDAEELESPDESIA